MLNRFNRNQPPYSGPTLDSYARTVEQILPGIGVDPAAARMTMEEGFGWSFQRGSAAIEIFVSQQEGVGYLQILSPIMHLPMGNLLPLYRRLLEMNLQLTAAAIGVYLDTVYVFSERPLEGMEAAEANSIISLVSTYADQLDDQLIQEFGGRPYSRV